MRLLEVGPRPEEILEQRAKVIRAQEWYDLSRADLRRRQEAHRNEVALLGQQVLQYDAEVPGIRAL